MRNVREIISNLWGKTLSNSLTLGLASDFASLQSSEILSLPFTQKRTFLTLKKTQHNAWIEATVTQLVTFYQPMASQYFRP